MKKRSEASKAVADILRAAFGDDVAYDESRGDANWTVRADGKRYRVYIDDDFDDDYLVTRSSSDRILGGLLEALRLSVTGAVLVTVDGLKEHPGADF